MEINKFHFLQLQKYRQIFARGIFLLATVTHAMVARPKGQLSKTETEYGVCGHVRMSSHAIYWKVWTRPASETLFVLNN